MRTTIWIVLGLLATAWWCQSCTSCGGNGGDPDSSTDTDADADSDADGDSDTDGDADTDTDADADSDADSDTDADSDADTDSDTDADADTDTNSDPALPACCERITISDDMHWEGSHAMHGDRMVWRQWDSATSSHVIKMRQLSTSAISVIDSDPQLEMHPVVFGDWVYWEQETSPGDWKTTEVFRMNVDDLIPQQMTDNYCGDYRIRPGSEYFVHLRNCDGSSTDPLYTTNVNTLVSTQISPDASSGPGTQGFMFDGVRYVAWGWHGDSEPNGDRIYLYDIQNPSPPTTPVYPEAYRQMGGMISGGKIFAATGVLEFTEGWDIWVYDIASNTTSWMDHSLWDQYNVAVDGHVAVYADTEALGLPAIEADGQHIEIKDLESSVSRQISILPGNYWQLAISGHYLAFIRGNPTKELFVCDLLEGGFMNSDGHICPLEGCGETDAGPDAGPDGGK